jgi:hypothetical protein
LRARRRRRHHRAPARRPSAHPGPRRPGDARGGPGHLQPRDGADDDDGGPGAVGAARPRDARARAPRGAHDRRRPRRGWASATCSPPWSTALQGVGIQVSLFVAPTPRSSRPRLRSGSTRWSCTPATTPTRATRDGASSSTRSAAGRGAGPRVGLRVAAGHGLTVANVRPTSRDRPTWSSSTSATPSIADAVIVGMAEAVRAMRAAMDRGRGAVIVGLGLDVVSAPRVERRMWAPLGRAHRGAGAHGVGARRDARADGRRVEWLAGRIAAKEAASKALGRARGHSLAPRGGGPRTAGSAHAALLRASPRRGPTRWGCDARCSRSPTTRASPRRWWCWSPTREHFATGSPVRCCLARRYAPSTPSSPAASRGAADGERRPRRRGADPARMAADAAATRGRAGGPLATTAATAWWSRVTSRRASPTRPRVVYVGDPARSAGRRGGDARRARRTAVHCHTASDDDPAALVGDATGGRRALRHRAHPAARGAERAPGCARPNAAGSAPGGARHTLGLDADRGAALGGRAFRADLTCTFAASKVGLHTGPGDRARGRGGGGRPRGRAADGVLTAVEGWLSFAAAPPPRGRARRTRATRGECSWSAAARAQRGLRCWRRGAHRMGAGLVTVGSRAAASLESARAGDHDPRCRGRGPRGEAAQGLLTAKADAVVLAPGLGLDAWATAGDRGAVLGGARCPS